MEEPLSWRTLFRTSLSEAGYSTEDTHCIFRIEMEARRFFEFSGIMPEWLMLQDIVRKDGEIHYYWVSRSTSATCPHCHQESTEKKGDHDNKTVQDIPRDNMAVYHHIKANRFYCGNADCGIAMFAERILSLMDENARKTRRFVNYCVERAVGSTCQYAEGEIRREGGVISNDTLGRYLKSEGAKLAEANLTDNASVEVLSVDDFNLRKGDSSSGCTVFVNGETGKVLLLVSGTTKGAAEAVSRRFKSAKILSRDRATAYASAGKELGFEQVADGFHLVDNAQKAVEDALAATIPVKVYIRKGDGWISADNDGASNGMAPCPTRVRVSEDVIADKVKCAGLTPAKEKKYRGTMQVLELDSAGMRTAEIAKTIGVSVPEVRALRRSAAITLREVDERIAERSALIAAAPAPKTEVPGERATKTVGGERVKPATESIVEPYRQTVIDMWKEGGNHRTIHPVLAEMGYTGSANAIYQYILKLKKESPDCMVRIKQTEPPKWAEEFDIATAEALPELTLDVLDRKDIYNEILRQARETRPKSDDNGQLLKSESDTNANAGDGASAERVEATSVNDGEGMPNDSAEANVPKKKKSKWPASAKTSPLPRYILELMYGPEIDEDSSEPDNKKN